MENTWSAAKVNNNLRPMYVKEILFEHTDENHICERYCTLSKSNNLFVPLCDFCRLKSF